MLLTFNPWYWSLEQLFKTAIYRTSNIVKRKSLAEKDEKEREGNEIDETNILQKLTKIC